MSEDYDRTTEMSETEGGFIRLRVRIKRGSDVRNEDDLSAEIVCEDLDELKENLDEFHELLYTEAERARQFQPATPQGRGGEDE